MNCSDVRTNIDDCIDAYLTEAEHKNVLDHIYQCSSCREIYQLRTKLKQLVASTKLQIPEPSSDLADKIIKTRKARKPTRQIRLIKRRNWFIGISAVAASFTILAIIPGISPFLTPQPDQKPLMTAFTLPTLHEPHTVGLLFKSKQYLENVTFSIEVPAEMELQGFSGKQKVRWSGSLKQGKNLISLPVIANSPTSGILILSLEHVKEIKTFKVQLDSKERKNGISLRFSDFKVT